MQEYRLSKDLIDQWQYYGFVVRYTNNSTNDIEIKNSNSSLYFDRLSEYNLFTLTTNLSMNEEILKLAYKTLSFLNNIKRDNNQEETNATKVIWFDGDKEVEEKIEED